jgi:hypothetical protein
VGPAARPQRRVVGPLTPDETTAAERRGAERERARMREAVEGLFTDSTPTTRAVLRIIDGSSAFHPRPAPGEGTPRA